MKAFLCTTCGHIAFETSPDKCPVCFLPTFIQNDNVFKEAEEKSKEAAVKHIPAITVSKTCRLIPDSGCLDVTVRIGSALHPMEVKHFIQFIDCYVDAIFAARMHLTPGLNPAACYHLKTTGSKVTLVEKCSVHGHWMSEASLK